MKKIIIPLLIFTFLLAGCSNPNPNINNKDSSKITSSTKDAASEAIPEYINKDELAHRSYELHFLLGQDGFNSPDDISANAIVQFAFCHIYYENLTEMPSSGMKMREAATDDIKIQILKYFGAVTIDITKSDLYNKSSKKFTMWEPTYGTDIYYDAKLVKNKSGLYVCSTTFYSDSEKQNVLGKTVLTVEDNEDRAIIKKLSSR